jgi:hypothetical protein
MPTSAFRWARKRSCPKIGQERLPDRHAQVWAESVPPTHTPLPSSKTSLVNAASLQ